MKIFKKSLCFMLAMTILATTCLSDYTTAYASAPDVPDAL